MPLPNYRNLGSYTTTGSSGGGTAFGGVPKATPLPDPFGNLSAVYPNLSPTNTAVSADIMGELKGQLSPETVANIQDNAASFGVATGMPGSDFAGYRGLRNLGITSEQLQQQGLKDYNATIPTVFGTQTLNPQLQSEIQAYNNQLAAAPDPAKAAQYQEDMFDKYLQATRGPQGGSGEPWWQQGGNMASTFGAGTYQSSPGTYHTPYMG